MTSFWKVWQHFSFSVFWCFVAQMNNLLIDRIIFRLFMNKIIAAALGGIHFKSDWGQINLSKVGLFFFFFNGNLVHWTIIKSCTHMHFKTFLTKSCVPCFRWKIWTIGVFQGHKTFRQQWKQPLPHSTERLPLWSADELEEYFLYFCLGEENLHPRDFFVDDFQFFYFVIMKSLIWDQRELVSKRPAWCQEV